MLKRKIYIAFFIVISSIIIAVALGLIIGFVACSKKCEHKNIVIDEGFSATCIESGLTDGVHCADWHEIMQPQIVIPAAGHVESELIVDLAADCTNKGSGHKICTVCKAILEIAEISETSHLHTKTERKNYIASTCSDAASYYDVIICEDCGFTLSEERKTLPKLPHTESELIIDLVAYCTNKGSGHKICTVCKTILEITDIPQEGHNLLPHQLILKTKVLDILNISA